MAEKSKLRVKKKTCFILFHRRVLCSLGQSEMPEGISVTACRTASPLFQDSTQKLHFVVLGSQDVYIPCYRHPDSSLVITKNIQAKKKTTHTHTQPQQTPNQTNNSPQKKKKSEKTPNHIYVETNKSTKTNQQN